MAGDGGKGGGGGEKTQEQINDERFAQRVAAASNKKSENTSTTPAAITSSAQDRRDAFGLANRLAAAQEPVRGGARAAAVEAQRAAVAQGINNQIQDAIGSNLAADFAETGRIGNFEPLSTDPATRKGASLADFALAQDLAITNPATNVSAVTPAFNIPTQAEIMGMVDLTQPAKNQVMQDIYDVNRVTPVATDEFSVPVGGGTLTPSYNPSTGAVGVDFTVPTNIFSGKQSNAADIMMDAVNRQSAAARAPSGIGNPTATADVSDLFSNIGTAFDLGPERVRSSTYGQSVPTYASMREQALAEGIPVGEPDQVLTGGTIMQDVQKQIQNAIQGSAVGAGDMTLGPQSSVAPDVTRSGIMSALGVPSNYQMAAAPAAPVNTMMDPNAVAMGDTFTNVFGTLTQPLEFLGGNLVKRGNTYTSAGSGGITSSRKNKDSGIARTGKTLANQLGLGSFFGGSGS